MSEIAEPLRNLKCRHVILVPTGHLTLLPLHAAEYIADVATVSFVDEFPVSFAPNIHILRAAGMPEASECSHLLAVGNPLPSDQPLTASVIEVQNVARFFSSGATLVGREATRAATLQHIQHATHIHFACHARFDPGGPLNCESS